MSSSSSTATSSIYAPGGAVSFGPSSNNTPLYIAIGAAALLVLIFIFWKGKR